MKYGRYSAKPYLFLFLLIFLVVFSTASLIYYSQYKAIRKEKSDGLSSLFRIKERQFLNWIHERKSDALFYKKNADVIYHFAQLIKHPENQKFRENLQAYSYSITSTGHYKSLIFLNNKNIPVLSFPDSVKSHHFSGICFTNLDSAKTTDEIIMTNLHFTPDSQIIFHLIIPFIKSAVNEEQFLGFLLLNIDPADEFYPLLQTFQIHSKTAEALLVKRDNGQIVFLNELRHTKDAALKMKFPLAMYNLAAVKAVQGTTGAVDAIDYRNKNVLATVGPVAGTPWFLVIKMDKDEIYAELRKFAVSTWTVSILLIIVGVLLLRIIWQRNSAMYEKEQLNHKYSYQLIKQKYSLVSKYANDAILLWDENHKIIDFNDKALELYGYTEEEMPELALEQLRTEKCSKNLNDIIDTLRNTHGIRYETLHQRKDGAILPVDISTRSFAIDGKIHYQSIVRDITERKLVEQKIINLNAELEDRVKVRTDQLAAINRELETFTYSVSHDLKAPLRGIDGYSRLLLEDHSKSLNDEALHFLKNIRESTLQMNELIDNLLEYSRLERHTLSPAILNIQQTVTTIINQVIKDYSEHLPVIENNLPEIELTVDSEGLSITLRNLIENAVKFTRQSRNPKIVIGLKEKDESYILYVRDNGIGFDMQYHNRIFEIFQRLHRVEDYPGTGVGLAMVKKSMERMGGRVWAESSPAKGSVFYIEIPKKIRE